MVVVVVVVGRRSLEPLDEIREVYGKVCAQQQRVVLRMARNLLRK